MSKTYCIEETNSLYHCPDIDENTEMGLDELILRIIEESKTGDAITVKGVTFTISK